MICYKLPRGRPKMMLAPSMTLDSLVELLTLMA